MERPSKKRAFILQVFRLNRTVPPPAITQSAPGGINIGRDNYGNPTVNTYAPPKRSLTDVQVKELAQFGLSIPESKIVEVESANTAKDCTDYAKAIYDALTKTGKNKAKIGHADNLAPLGDDGSGGVSASGTVVCVDSANSLALGTATKLKSILSENGDTVTDGVCSGTQNNECVFRTKPISVPG